LVDVLLLTFLLGGGRTAFPDRHAGRLPPPPTALFFILFCHLVLIVLVLVVILLVLVAVILFVVGAVPRPSAPGSLGGAPPSGSASPLGSSDTAGRAIVPCTKDTLGTALADRMPAILRICTRSSSTTKFTIQQVANMEHEM